MPIHLFTSEESLKFQKKLTSLFISRHKTNIRIHIDEVSECLNDHCQEMFTQTHIDDLFFGSGSDKFANYTNQLVNFVKASIVSPYDIRQAYFNYEFWGRVMIDLVEKGDIHSAQAIYTALRTPLRIKQKYVSKECEKHINFFGQNFTGLNLSTNFNKGKDYLVNRRLDVKIYSKQKYRGIPEMVSLMAMISAIKDNYKNTITDFHESDEGQKLVTKIVKFENHLSALNGSLSGPTCHKTKRKAALKLVKILDDVFSVNCKSERDLLKDLKSRLRELSETKVPSQALLETIANGLDTVYTKLNAQYYSRLYDITDYRTLKEERSVKKIYKYMGGLQYFNQKYAKTEPYNKWKIQAILDDADRFKDEDPNSSSIEIYAQSSDNRSLKIGEARSMRSLFKSVDSLLITKVSIYSRYKQGQGPVAQAKEKTAFSGLIEQLNKLKTILSSEENIKRPSIVRHSMFNSGEDVQIDRPINDLPRIQAY